MLEVKGAGLLGAVGRAGGSQELFAGGGLYYDQVNTALNGMKNTGGDVAGPAGLGGADGRGNGPGTVESRRGRSVRLGLQLAPPGPGGFPSGGCTKGSTSARPRSPSAGRPALEGTGTARS